MTKSFHYQQAKTLANKKYISMGQLKWNSKGSTVAHWIKRVIEMIAQPAGVAPVVDTHTRSYYYNACKQIKGVSLSKKWNESGSTKSFWKSELNRLNPISIYKKYSYAQYITYAGHISMPVIAGVSKYELIKNIIDFWRDGKVVIVEEVDEEIEELLLDDEAEEAAEEIVDKIIIEVVDEIKSESEDVVIEDVESESEEIVVEEVVVEIKKKPKMKKPKMKKRPKRKRKPKQTKNTMHRRTNDIAEDLPIPLPLELKDIIVDYKNQLELCSCQKCGTASDDYEGGSTNLNDDYCGPCYFLQQARKHISNITYSFTDDEWRSFEHKCHTLTYDRKIAIWRVLDFIYNKHVHINFSADTLLWVAKTFPVWDLKNAHNMMYGREANEWGSCFEIMFGCETKERRRSFLKDVGMLPEDLIE